MTPAVGRRAVIPLRSGPLGSALLGAGCVAWAAAPLIRTRYADLALFLASLGVAAGALRLALAEIPVPEDTYVLTAAMRFWLRFLAILRLVPWEEGARIAILWLEVQHPARPWHTALLGAALIAYLLAAHLAESGASARVLRPQVRVLAVGAALLALGAGAAMVPAAGPGAGSALPRLVAAGALIAAAVLVLPYVARGDSPGRRPGPGPETRSSPQARPLSLSRAAQTRPRDRRSLARAAAVRKTGPDGSSAATFPRRYRRSFRLRRRSERGCRKRPGSAPR